MGVRVRQKVKGKGQPWWVFVAHNRQRTSIKVGTKKAAEVVADEIAAELKLGKFDMNRQKNNKPKPTFKDFSDDWIDITVPATCKPSTLREYQDILKNHVLPIFSDQEITGINKGQVKDFLLSKLNDGYAYSTVGHIRNCLSGVFNLAMDHEVIVMNPAQQLRGIIKKKNSKDDINPLSVAELTLLLDTVEEHYKGHYALVTLLSLTGMRIGEAFGLKWGDIDFKDRFIEVKRNYVRGKIGTPKNGKTRRVDITPQLTSLLKTHRTESKKKGFELGMGEIPEFVFTNRDGGFMDQSHFRRRVFKKALTKAEIREIRIHDLRHTYATIRLENGDNIADVSNQLGHHSVKMTWDVYYHWVPGNKKSEVDKLDSVIFPNSSAPYTHPTDEFTKKEVANFG